MRADTVSKLMSLKGLLDSGAITLEDFEREKALLLSEVVPASIPIASWLYGERRETCVLWAGVVFLVIACAIAAYLLYWPSGSPPLRWADCKRSERKIGC